MFMPNEITMKEIIDATFEGADDLVEWCDEIYNENILPHFKEVNEFYEKIEKSEWRPISDDDLEMILTTLPLRLYSATEAVNRLGIHHSVMKFNAKRGIDVEDEDARKMTIQAMQAVANAYETIIDRAEREMMFCRELIMAAKKIWDARKRSEGIMPVSEVVPTITDSKLHGYKAGGKNGNVQRDN